ncbi:MAG: hypothetical protein FWB91_06900 [Defluviitaleaceae bacterium]|nr:hypothetical protein [Defluviitaleaceae bacterium]
MNKVAENGSLQNDKILMAQRVKARMSNTIMGNGPCRSKEQTFMSFVLDNVNIMDNQTLDDFRALIKE